MIKNNVKENLFDDEEKKDCCKVNGSMTRSLYCLTSEQNTGLR